MRVSLTLVAVFATLLILGIAAEPTHAKTRSAWGTGDYAGYCGTVTVGGLSYEGRFHKWTQSSHSYTVTRMGDGVRLSVPFEFQHGVWELDKWGDKERLINNSQQQGIERTDRNGFVSRDGTQGIKCRVQVGRRYLIEAYTAIRVNDRKGTLDVFVNDTATFVVWE